MPVLSIGGSDDALTPPRVARAIGRRLGGTSRLYDGQAHHLVREPGWEVIADDVLTRIDRLPWSYARRSESRSSSSTGTRRLST